MSRFGFTNIYLQAGIVLILAALGGLAWLAFFGTPGDIGFGMSMWFASASFLAGLVLYAIGRVVKIARSMGKARTVGPG